MRPTSTVQAPHAPAQPLPVGHAGGSGGGNPAAVSRRPPSVRRDLGIVQQKAQFWPICLARMKLVEKPSREIGFVKSPNEHKTLAVVERSRFVPPYLESLKVLCAWSNWSITAGGDLQMSPAVSNRIRTEQAAMGCGF